MGFAGMNMAQNMGAAQASNLFQQAGVTGSGKQTDIDATNAQMQANQAAAGATTTGAAATGSGAASPSGGAGTWSCECGQENSGNFCSNCGKPKPAPVGVWNCECGQENSGNFCSNCGKPRP